MIMIRGDGDGTLSCSIFVDNEDTSSKPHKAETGADEKEGTARTLCLLMACFQKIISDVFMTWMMPKKSGQLSRLESLERGYDGFKKTPITVGCPGASVSECRCNHKFLRFPSACMGQFSFDNEIEEELLDTLSIVDLYKNLSVFEQDNSEKTYLPPLTSDNVAFLSQAKALIKKHKPRSQLKEVIV
ncbi:hypothetical protein Tco_0538690 [Tanacetum coccineum]